MQCQLKCININLKLCLSILVKCNSKQIASSHLPCVIMQGIIARLMQGNKIK